MLQQNGGRVSWEDFQKAAMAANQDYNKNWLKTEYHQTIATAQMAAKWEDIQRTKDLYPNLRYVTVGDERVRAQHRQWDGIVLPIDHPWWKTHLPPNDWSCRCDVERTDDEPTQPNLQENDVKKEFANNPGQSGMVFKNSAYENHLNEKEREEALRLYEFNQYNNSPDYYNVEMNSKGGLKAIHKRHKFDKTLGHYETEVQDFFFNRGEKLILEQELNTDKQLDGLLNDLTIEIKSIMGNSSRTIQKRIAQIQEKKADVGILYFPDNFYMANLEEAIENYFGEMPKLIIIHKNKIIKDGR
ncbi:MAG: phage minor head protein [Flavobacteriaceae bacterium]|nr:phage minor head protein [Flavobacteriaceae bacterium]